MLNRSASLAMSTRVLKALPGKLDIKRHSPSILYILIYYRLCDKINHDDMIEVTVFFYNLAVNFANIVQYNKVNRAFEVSMLDA